MLLSSYASGQASTLVGSVVGCLDTASARHEQNPAAADRLSRGIEQLSGDFRHRSGNARNASVV
jgi:hypothetical protein